MVLIIVRWSAESSAGCRYSAGFGTYRRDRGVTINAVAMYSSGRPQFKKHYVEKNRLRTARKMRKLGQETPLNSIGTDSKSYTMELDRGRGKNKTFEPGHHIDASQHPAPTAVMRHY